MMSGRTSTLLLDLQVGVFPPVTVFVLTSTALVVSSDLESVLVDRSIFLDLPFMSSLALLVSSSRYRSPDRWTAMWSPSRTIVRELNGVVRIISVILTTLALLALAGGAAS